MNSHTVKITGLSEIESPLEIGKSYEIKSKTECTSITKTNNDDGSFTFRFLLRQIQTEIIREDGEVIRVRDNKKQSQKLRSQLVAIAIDRGEDPEKFYEDTMVKFRHYTLEILDFLKGLENV